MATRPKSSAVPLETWSSCYCSCNKTKGCARTHWNHSDFSSTARGRTGVDLSRTPTQVQQIAPTPVVAQHQHNQFDHLLLVKDTLTRVFKSPESLVNRSERSLVHVGFMHHHVGEVFQILWSQDWRAVAICGSTGLGHVPEARTNVVGEVLDGRQDLHGQRRRKRTKRGFPHTIQKYTLLLRTIGSDSDF